MTLGEYAATIQDCARPCPLCLDAHTQDVSRRTGRRASRIVIGLYLDPDRFLAHIKAAHLIVARQAEAQP